MNKEMLDRIANIKTHEVENELPRIHIENDGTLFQLMVWRNKNKDKVRNLKPIIKEGIISMMHKKNYIYFLQSDNDVYLMNKSSESEYVAFIFNMENSTVTPIVNKITFYPKKEVNQDILTVYASTLAYLNEIGIETVERGETFTISNVLS